MEEIKFSTGKQEFRLNDQVSVSFNPTDAAFVERIYDVFEKLDAEQQTYRSEMDACADKRKIFDIARQHDEKMREMIDGLFEAPRLCGTVRLYERLCAGRRSAGLGEPYAGYSGSGRCDNDAGKAAHESAHSEIHGALGEKVKDCGDVPDGISPQNEESERVVIP